MQWIYWFHAVAIEPSRPFSSAVHTAKTEQENIVKGFEIGSQDYFTKPFNPQKLLARVQTQRDSQDKNQELWKVITTQNELNCIQMAIEMSVKAANMGVQVRFGINSGDCTDGSFGSVERIDYTIGPNVNLYARLEQVGKLGRIFISEHTYSLIKDKYE
jgi:hypothetical protein